MEGREEGKKDEGVQKSLEVTLQCVGGMKVDINNHLKI